MNYVYSIAEEGDLCILCILLQGRGRVFRKPGAAVLLLASGKFPTQPIFLLLFKWESLGEIITLNNSTTKNTLGFQRYTSFVQNMSLTFSSMLFLGQLDKGATEPRGRNNSNCLLLSQDPPSAFTT